MRQTPLDYLISSMREQWLYKSSHFIYPYKFGTEDDYVYAEQGEYACLCIIVEKEHHETRKRFYKLDDLFDALFVDTNRFKFLKTIEAKHKLLQ